MPYINPAQLIQDRFKSPLDAVLPIVPSFMANKRARDQLAFEQAQAAAIAPYRAAQMAHVQQQTKMAPEELDVRRAANVGLEEYREAQTRVNTEQAAKLKLVNDYLRLMGGPDIKEGKGLPYDITPEEFFRSQLNLPQRQMVTGYDPESKTYSRQPDKPGLVTKPETGKTHTLNYWMPDDPSMSSQIVPLEDYDQTVAELKKRGAIIGTKAPLPIRLKELEEEQNVRYAAKLKYLTDSLKARGIDIEKFNPQQKLWKDTVLFLAKMQADGIAADWRMSSSDMATANRNLMIDTINQFDLINAGQPPSWLSKGEPTERPFVSPQRKEGETEQKYQQRIKQTTPYRAIPPVQPAPPKRLPRETVEQYMQRVGQ